MRHPLPLLAAVLMLSATAARADLGDELAILLPDDSPAQFFGRSVSIKGETAIVGAPQQDENGTNSGSAYLFDITTGQQLAALLPDDGEAGDRFGYSVAISGTTAIVASWLDSDNGLLSGSAYLFNLATGQQIAKLLPDDGAGQDYFGISVAISGNIAIVGAWANDDNGTDSGSAYLFDATTGQQLAKILPDDGAAFDLFGWCVAISGSTVIIGAHGDDDNGSKAGSAYLFDISDPENPEQIAKIFAGDAAAQDEFGRSVAISGETAIVGSPQDDDNGANSGSVYLFDAADGGQLAKLLPSDGAAWDLFGHAVAISGSIAIIGAFESDDNGPDSGSAYLFNTATGQQLAKLLSSDGAANDEFGASVAISGTTAIVAARLNDDNGPDSGAAYLFDAAGAPACPWDFDGDGTTGPADLAVVLGNWGPNAGHPADLDGDGVVGPADLALVLGNWGPCQ